MYSLTELQEIKKNVINELNLAKDGKPSSFPFITHSLSHESLVLTDEIFQVIAVGGSYYRKTLLKTIDGTLTVISNETGKLPIFNSEDDFLLFIEKHLDKTVTHVAVNFAYPLTPIMRHTSLDGILQNGSKEHLFEGMIDKTVGRLIEDHVRSKWDKTVHVSIANDTMCLLLSGLMTNSWETLAAGIIGTGLNFAIFLDRHTAANLESANFKKYKPTEEAKIIDAKSISPGNALYEKETAGAYLYQHFNIYIQKHQIDYPALKSTDELDALARANIPNISDLAQSFFDHSASCVAAQIAGILEFCKRDLTFIMQGSLYWKAHNYNQKVGQTVAELTTQYKASYLDIKDSDIYGAAELLVHE